MSEHSEEFEREVLDAVRELRGTVRAVKIAIGVVVLLVLLAFVAGLVNVLVSGGDSGTDGGGGGDVHAPLKDGASLSFTTEAGLKVTARITSYTVTGQRVHIDTDVRGTPGGTWYLYLASNQRVAMQDSDVIQTTEDRTQRGYDAEIPAGDRLQFVQFSPDDSHGDAYFDVR